MHPIEILTDEHRLIRQALDSFGLATHKMEQGINPPAEFFEKAVEFARTFIDKRHHFKEEYLMFGRLAEKHQGELDAQIEALRQQHDHGREFISEMGNALDGYSKGQDAHVTDMLENLAALVALYRHHIHREDRTFFPMVEESLSQDELDDLAGLFAKEDEKTGRDTFERMRRLVDELVTLL
jgi:hemerythrin-like domain-containing protein